MTQRKSPVKAEWNMECPACNGKIKAQQDTIIHDTQAGGFIHYECSEQYGRDYDHDTDNPTK